MKKLLTFALMMIGAVLMSTLVTSCRDHQKHDETITSETLDSIEDVNFVMDVVYQCKASDVDEFMAKMDRIRQSYKDDQILYSLSPITVRSIANVVIERFGMFDKHDIVEEYLSNRQLYDGVDKANKQIPEDECSICNEQVDSGQNTSVPKDDHPLQTIRHKHGHSHTCNEGRIE